MCVEEISLDIVKMVTSADTSILKNSVLQQTAVYIIVTRGIQRAYGRCKFAEYCKYSHEKSKDILENRNKIDILEKKIENLQETNNRKVNIETKKEIENLEKEKLRILSK